MTGHGAVVWITGLPASGKSTLAALLQERLAGAGRTAALLDSDAVREALVPRRSYRPEERDAFYATLGRLAALLSAQGLLVLVAATAPRREHRDEARRLAPRFVEVFVQTSADECAHRDTKGLWERARSGEIANLPGFGTPYEPPASAEVTALGGQDLEAVERILMLLELPTP